MEESLFSYGRYAVCRLYEDGLSKESPLRDTIVNYAVKNTETGADEARTMSLPQAISLAIALERTMENLMSEAAKAPEGPKDSLLN